MLFWMILNTNHYPGNMKHDIASYLNVTNLTVLVKKGLEQSTISLVTRNAFIIKNLNVALK